MPHIATGDSNVKAFPIEGPMREERYRLKGMTDEERAWRKQWLQDQVLTEREPMEIPNWYQIRFNPLRRLYRWPLDKVFIPLIPVMGSEAAHFARYFVGKIALGYFAALWGWYYFKYNQRDWTRKSGWIVYHTKTAVLPGDPGYPSNPTYEPREYQSEGFLDSPI